jgi:signal transduction histidine kinase
MDLKWLLVRRVTLVALACLFVGSAFAIWQTNREAKRQNIELADSVGRQLELQLALRTPFPDWDLVTSYALRPGQCVQLLSPGSTVKRSSCVGINTAAVSTPHWFSEAYHALVGGTAAFGRDVTYRGITEGRIRTSFEPLATASAAWLTIAPLIGLSTALIGALCLVAYFVIDRALRPTRQILSGLNLLTAGDLSFRLPVFRLRELTRISEGLNTLASALGKATKERAEFARRLVDAQEEERRHIARELHDEVAQKLSALSALAVCVRTSAQLGDTTLVREAGDLEKMASDLMVMLRRTLTHLRPQEIDDLGLLASLDGLVAEHNDIACGRTRYSLVTRGDIEQLRPETSAHVYRIVQEALNNAAKHAQARNIEVVLDRLDIAGSEKIGLSVIDDGCGQEKTARQSAHVGVGLIGMRERVLALSGDFTAGPLPDGGFGLRVEFPSLRVAS